MSARKSKISKRSYSIDSSNEALSGTNFWHDSGEKYSENTIYTDNLTGLYSIWSESGIYYITNLSDVGNSSAENFNAIDINGDYTGANGWTGSISVSGDTISDAWYRAEKQTFDSLVNFSGGKLGIDCFLGTLPVKGDAEELQFVNVWQMTSGGSTEYDTDRISGSNACWRVLRADCAIESIWETRQEAMEFAGLVSAWLVNTNNVTNDSNGNVIECRMTELPEEPEVYRTKGENRAEYWKQEIKLELIYKTV